MACRVGKLQLSIMPRGKALGQMSLPPPPFRGSVHSLLLLFKTTAIFKYYLQDFLGKLSKMCTKKNDPVASHAGFFVSASEKGSQKRLL